RMAVVNRGQRRAIARKRLLMRYLIRGSLEMLLATRGNFLRTGLRANSALSVETHPAHRGGVDHRAIHINISHHGCVYIEYRSVIPEHIASPDSAAKADATVSESVIHATIKSNVRTPVACVPQIGATGKTPIAGSPQHAEPRRR